MAWLESVWLRYIDTCWSQHESVRLSAAMLRGWTAREIVQKVRMRGMCDRLAVTPSGLPLWDHITYTRVIRMAVFLRL